MWTRALAAVASTLLPRHLLAPDFDPALLTHDPEAQAAHRDDPLTQSAVTLRLGVELLRARDRVLELAPEITVPTLVLHGELDPIAEAAGSRRLFDLLGSRDKELRTYPRSRHELHNELPDRRNAMLADLLWWLDCHRE
jgi:alpha-beta hydrolase superfamily lysophospholipase